MDINVVTETMEPAFSNEYAYWMGVHDARWLGHKDPNRSFGKPGDTDPRTPSYFAGLRYGMTVTQWHGVVMCCCVKWDRKPRIDANPCCGKSTHVAISYTQGEPSHTLMLCERHAMQAMELNRIAVNSNGENPAGFSEPWVILPIAWC